MKLYEKFQAMMTAAAFAEEGDFRTARELFEETKAEALKKQPVQEHETSLHGNLATGHSK